MKKSAAMKSKSAKGKQKVQEVGTCVVCVCVYTIHVVCLL